MVLRRLSPWLIVALFLVQLAWSDLEMYCHDKNCYEILELNRENVTPADIRKAYLKLSQQYHPDKLSGDSDENGSKFHEISLAYNVLKDEAVRKEYNEFLDHPERFYLHYATWVKRNYFGHQESLFSVFCMILLTATVADFIYKKSSYTDLRERLIHEAQVQERVRALRGESAPANPKKSNGRKRREYDADFALTITDKEISSVVQHDDWSGHAPLWSDLLPVRMLSWPKRIFLQIIWALHWFAKFTILRCEYGEAEKLFLIRYNLGLSEKQWDRIPEHRRDSYMQMNLWDIKAYQAWRRKQRSRKGGAQYDEAFVE